MANRWGNSGNSVRLYFWGLQNHCRWWLQPWNKKTLDRKSTRLNSSHIATSRMPSSAWLTTPKPLCGSQQTVENSRDGNTRPLTCLLRNLYAGQEATIRTGHGTTDWLQIGKGVHQGCILSPCLFNLYAEYIMQNAGLDEGQAGIKVTRRNISNLRYADDTTLKAESEE